MVSEDIRRLINLVEQRIREYKQVNLKAADQLEVLLLDFKDKMHEHRVDALLPLLDKQLTQLRDKNDPKADLLEQTIQRLRQSTEQESPVLVNREEELARKETELHRRERSVDERERFVTKREHKDDPSLADINSSRRA